MDKRKPEQGGFPFAERSEYVERDKLGTARRGRPERTRQLRMSVWTQEAFEHRLEHFMGAKERGPELPDEDEAVCVLEVPHGRAVFRKNAKDGNRYLLVFHEP